MRCDRCFPLNRQQAIVTRRRFRSLSRMAEYSTRLAALGDHETCVFDSGSSGRPVILIHALSLGHRVWADVIPLLLEKYRVIAYDLRGFGGAAGAPAVQSVFDFAKDL